MSDSLKKSWPYRLDKLEPGQQEAIFTHCQKVTLKEGVRWLKAEFNLHIGTETLSGWLRRRRAKQSITASERKIRPDCRLARLKPEQQEAIFAHCENITLDEGTRWLKHEFDVQLSSKVLSTWLRKQRADKAMAACLEDIRDDRDRALLVGNVVGTATVITEANSVLFSQAIFEEFRKPVGERDETRLVKYMNLALKAREQELRARTVDLGYSRFHFDAAEKSIKFATQLQLINESGDDERAKIEQAIVVLFGEAPSGDATPADPSAPAEETTPEAAA